MRFIIGLIAGALAGFAIYGEGLPSITAKLENLLPPGQKQTEKTADDSVTIRAAGEHITLPPEPVEQINVAPEVLPADQPATITVGTTQSDRPVAEVLAEPQFQAAWSRFRSEASASGFAARLSEALNVEFETIKLAPGKYEVGFFYLNESEREAILNALEAYTGYRAEQAT